MPSGLLSRRTSLSGNNGLLNALQFYSPGDEEGGQRTELVNNLTLTEVNAPGSAPGKLYQFCRRYSAASSQAHSRPSVDPVLSGGVGVDFTLAAWVKVFTASLTYQNICGKWNGNSSQSDYNLIFLGSASIFAFSIYKAPSINAAAVSTSVTLNEWHLVIGWYDALSNLIQLQIDNGIVFTANHSGGTNNGSSAFSINGFIFAEAEIGPVAMWRSDTGKGGVLKRWQRAALWNHGRGLRFDQFTSLPGR